MIRKVDIERDVRSIAEINAWYVKNTTVVFDTVSLTILEMKRKIEGLMDRYPFYVYESEGEVRGYIIIKDISVGSVPSLPVRILGSKIPSQCCTSMPQPSLHCSADAATTPHRRGLIGQR